VNLIDRRKLGYVCVMRNNGVLKNEEFLKTNTLDRGKDIQFKGAAPNDHLILSIKYYKNQDV
jgi:hypothetical protein